MSALVAVIGIAAAWYSHGRARSAEANALRLRRELRVERHAAMHDALTGLPNRRAFYQRGGGMLTEADRTPMVAMVVDLDDFKRVNDTLGHAAGDQALIVLARRLSALIGDGLVARLGGDEFVGVFACPANDEHWLGRASRILAGTMAAPMQVEGHTFSVTTSVGLAPVRPGADLDEVLHLADMAMYQAKSRREEPMVIAPHVRSVPLSRRRPGQGVGHNGQAHGITGPVAHTGPLGPATHTSSLTDALRRFGGAPA